MTDRPFARRIQLIGGFSTDPPPHPLELPRGQTQSPVPPPRVPPISISQPPPRGQTWDRHE